MKLVFVGRISHKVIIDRGLSQFTMPSTMHFPMVTESVPDFTISFESWYLFKLQPYASEAT